MVISQNKVLNRQWLVIKLFVQVRKTTDFKVLWSIKPDKLLPLFYKIKDNACLIVVKLFLHNKLFSMSIIITSTSACLV